MCVSVSFLACKFLEVGPGFFPYPLQVLHQMFSIYMSWRIKGECWLVHKNHVMKRKEHQTANQDIWNLVWIVPNCAPWIIHFPLSPSFLCLQTKRFWALSSKYTLRPPYPHPFSAVAYFKPHISGSNHYGYLLICLSASTLPLCGGQSTLFLKIRIYLLSLFFGHTGSLLLHVGFL